MAARQVWSKRARVAAVELSALAAWVAFFAACMVVFYAAALQRQPLEGAEIKAFMGVFWFLYCLSLLSGPFATNALGQRAAVPASWMRVLVVVLVLSMPVLFFMALDNECRLKAAIPLSTGSGCDV